MTLLVSDIYMGMNPLSRNETNSRYLKFWTSVQPFASSCAEIDFCRSCRVELQLQVLLPPKLAADMETKITPYRALSNIGISLADYSDPCIMPRIEEGQ